MIYDIVEGTSDTLQFQLLESGSAVDLTNSVVTLLLEDRVGTTVASPGTISVVDSVTGRVQLTPTGTSVFVAANGPYYARWKITSLTGTISYVPSSIRDVWNIIGL